MRSSSNTSIKEEFRESKGVNRRLQRYPIFSQSGPQLGRQAAFALLHWRLLPILAGERKHHAKP